MRGTEAASVVTARERTTRDQKPGASVAARAWTGRSLHRRRLRLRLLRRASPHTLVCLALAACCVCALSLRGRRGNSAAPFPGGRGELHLPSLPVFVINGPEDYAARKWVEQQLVSVGISRYERINGVVVEADDCMRLSGEGCQQGLALAHLSAWRRIAARQLPVALVLEDDVTWHRDFATLLPRYLAQAPSNWQVVWLGQLRRDGMGTTEPPVRVRLTTTGEAPWTLHAYLITCDAAELLAKHYDFLLARVQSPHATGPFPYSSAQELQRLPWALSYRELKSDYFMGIAFHYFVPEREKPLWVSFQSTRRVPAALFGRTWVSGETNELGRLRNTRCTCEAWGDEGKCSPEEVRSMLPLMGAGLAFQNLCRYRRWALYNWVEQPQMAKAPTCAWLQERIRSTHDSDPTPHDCVDDVYPAFAKSTTPKEAVGGGGEANE